MVIRAMFDLRSVAVGFVGLPLSERVISKDNRTVKRSWFMLPSMERCSQIIFSWPMEKCQLVLRQLLELFNDSHDPNRDLIH